MDAGNKTVETAEAVEAFLDRVEPAERKADGREVATLMARVSGEPARMWGPGIIGFGRYRYRYESGREGEMCRIGFAPRKAELVLYLRGLEEPDFAGLGAHRRGKGCLYVKRLAAVDVAVLEQMIAKSFAYMGENDLPDV